jgi:DNA topoisomerase I
VPKPLVIVESPAKAKTISSILGRDFVVESSIGHIRDLPRNAKEIPEAEKNEAVLRTGGVDTANDFKPIYVVPPEKRKQVTKLKQAMKDASELILATDEDREGESIAWHLHEVLNPRIPVKRMVFHEITKREILLAVENPRELDRRLVDAQEARRILDRLVGWEVSPVLWRKVTPQAAGQDRRLSAGRVQSVAVKLIVDRERERIKFRAASWWDVEATFGAQGESFGAALEVLGGSKLATGNDFDSDGRPTRSDIVILDEARAAALATELRGASFTVRSVSEKPRTQRPSAPFMTSTLQQEASRKLRYGAQRTMRLAQSLYENGYITYMRTDSVTLSETAITAARAQVGEMFGAEFLPSEPRVYSSKVRNAQEAHEAIRPAGETFRTPEDVSGELADDELALYDLIWKRALASQMKDAELLSAEARIAAPSSAGDAEFVARGQVITFPGFRRVYVEGSDDPDAALADQEVRLPRLTEGESAAVEEMAPKSHETKPPARFTEASLVKILEEHGIGRPSTYAATIHTIQDAGYVWKKGTALVPSFTAFAVVQLLERHFTELVDEQFTARMEDDLDDIASGDKESVPWLSRFYFGNGAKGLQAMVSDESLASIDPREVGAIPIGDDIVVRVGRYGPYLQQGDRRTSLPDDIPPDELTVARAIELLDTEREERSLGTDPSSGLKVFAKAGRYGPYVQLGEPEEGSKTKPKTGSLFKTMSVEDITLDQALRLLSLPRVLGVDPADGEEIEALNGRYGPYIKKGKDSRSLDSEEQLFTITLEEALAILAQPKLRRGQREIKPLRELSADPVSGQPVVVMDGRYGPYVSDGETKASLRQGDDPMSVTIERAAELLADRRARGPAKPRRSAKKAAGPKKTTGAKTSAAAKKPPGATKAASGRKRVAKKAEPAGEG